MGDAEIRPSVSRPSAPTGPTIFGPGGPTPTFSSELPAIYAVNYAEPLTQGNITDREKEDWQKLFARLGITAAMNPIMGLMGSGGLNAQSLQTLNPADRGAAIVFVRTLAADAGYSSHVLCNCFDDLAPLLSTLKTDIEKLESGKRPSYLTAADWDKNSKTISLNLIRHLFLLSSQRISSTRAFNDGLARGTRAIVDYSSPNSPFAISRPLDRANNPAITSDFVDPKGQVFEVPDPNSPLGGFLRSTLTGATGDSLSAATFSARLTEFGGRAYTEKMQEINTAVSRLPGAGTTREQQVIRHAEAQVELKRLHGQVETQLQNASLNAALRAFATGKFTDQRIRESFIATFNSQPTFEKLSFLLRYQTEIVANSPSGEKGGLVNTFAQLAKLRGEIVAFGRTQGHRVYSEATGSGFTVEQLQSQFHSPLFQAQFSGLTQDYQREWGELNVVERMMSEAATKLPGKFELDTTKELIAKFIRTAGLIPNSGVTLPTQFQRWETLSIPEKIAALRQAQTMIQSASEKSPGFFRNFGLYAYSAETGLIRDGQPLPNFVALKADLENLEKELKDGRAALTRLEKRAYYVEQKAVTRNGRLENVVLVSVGAEVPREALASVGRYLTSTLHLAIFGDEASRLSQELNSSVSQLGGSTKSFADLAKELAKVRKDKGDENWLPPGNAIAVSLLDRALKADKALREHSDKYTPPPVTASLLERIGQLFKNYREVFAYNQEATIKPDLPINGQLLPGLTWESLVNIEIAVDGNKPEEAATAYLKSAGSLDRQAITNLNSLRTARTTRALSPDEIASRRLSTEAPLFRSFLDSQEQLNAMMIRALNDYGAGNKVGLNQALSIYRDFVSGKFSIAVLRPQTGDAQEQYFLFEPGTGARRPLTNDSPELIVAKAMLRFATPSFGQTTRPTLGAHGETKADSLISAAGNPALRTSEKDPGEEVSFRLADYLYSNTDTNQEFDVSSRDYNAAVGQLKTALEAAPLNKQFVQAILLELGQRSQGNPANLRRETLLLLASSTEEAFMEVLRDPALRQNLQANLPSAVSKVAEKFKALLVRKQTALLDNVVRSFRSQIESHPELKAKPELQAVLNQLNALIAKNKEIVEKQADFIKDKLTIVVSQLFQNPSLPISQLFAQGDNPPPQLVANIRQIITGILSQVANGYKPGEWNKGGQAPVNVVQNWTIIGSAEFSNAAKISINSVASVEAPRTAEPVSTGNLTYISQYDVNIWKDYNDFADFNGGEPIAAYRIGIYTLLRQRGLSAHNPVEQEGLIRAQITAQDIEDQVYISTSETFNFLGTKRNLSPDQVVLLQRVSGLLKENKTAINSLDLDEQRLNDPEYRQQILSKLFVAPGVDNPDAVRQDVLETILICRGFVRTIDSLAEQVEDGRSQLISVIRSEGRADDLGAFSVSMRTFGRDLWSRLAEYEQTGSRRAISNVDDSLVLSLKEQFYPTDINHLRTKPAEVSRERSEFLSSGRIDRDFLLHLIDDYGFLFGSSLMQISIGALPAPIDATDRTSMINRNPLLTGLLGDQQQRLAVLRQYIESRSNVEWGTLNVTAADDRETALVKFLVQGVVRFCKPENKRERGGTVDRFVSANAVPFRQSSVESVLDRAAQPLARMIKADLLQRGAAGGGIAWQSGVTLTDAELNVAVLNSVANLFERFISEMLAKDPGSPQQQGILLAIDQSHYKFPAGVTNTDEKIAHLRTYVAALRQQVASGQGISFNPALPRLSRDPVQEAVNVYITTILPLMGMDSSETGEGGINFALAIRQAVTEAGGGTKTTGEKVELRVLNFSSGEETLHATSAFAHVPTKTGGLLDDILDQVTGETGRPLSARHRFVGRDAERWLDRNPHNRLANVSFDAADTAAKTVQTMLFFRGLPVYDKVTGLIGNSRLIPNQNLFMRRAELGGKITRGVGAGAFAAGMLLNNRPGDYLLAGGYGLSLLAGSSAQRMSIIWLTQGTGFWTGLGRLGSDALAGDPYLGENARTFAYKQATAVVDLIGPFFPPVLLAQVLKNVYDGNYDDAVANAVAFSATGMMQDSFAETYTFTRSTLRGTLNPAIDAFIQVCQWLKRNPGANAEGTATFRQELFERYQMAEATKEFSINPTQETMGEIIQRAGQKPDSRLGRLLRSSGGTRIAEAWNRTLAFNFENMQEVLLSPRRFAYRVGRGIIETYRLHNPERIARAMGQGSLTDYTKAQLHEQAAYLTERAVNHPTERFNLEITIDGSRPTARRGTLAFEVQSLNFETVPLELYGHEYAAALEERINYQEMISRSHSGTHRRAFAQIDTYFQEPAARLVGNMRSDLKADIAKRYNIPLAEIDGKLTAEVARHLANQVGDQSIRALSYGEGKITGRQISHFGRARVHLQPTTGSRWFGTLTSDVKRLSSFARLDDGAFAREAMKPENRAFLESNGITDSLTPFEAKAEIIKLSRHHLNSAARSLDGHSDWRAYWEQTEGGKNLKSEIEQLNSTIEEFNRTSLAPNEQITPVKVKETAFGRSIEQAKATGKALKKTGTQFAAVMIAALLAEEVLKSMGIKNPAALQLGGITTAQLAEWRIKRGGIPQSRAELAKDLRGTAAAIAYTYLASGLYNGILNAAGVKNDSFMRNHIAQLAAGLAGAHVIGQTVSSLREDVTLARAMIRGGLRVTPGTAAGIRAMSIGSASLAALAIFQMINDLGVASIYSQQELNFRLQVHEEGMNAVARAVLNGGPFDKIVGCAILGFLSLPMFDKLGAIAVSSGEVKVKAEEYLKTITQMRDGTRAQLLMRWMGGEDGAVLNYDGGPREAAFFQSVGLPFDGLASAMRTKVEFPTTYRVRAHDLSDGASGVPTDPRMAEREMPYPEGDIHLDEARAYQFLRENAGKLEYAGAHQSRLTDAISRQFPRVDIQDFMQRVTVKQLQDEIATLVSSDTREAEDILGRTDNHQLRTAFNSDGTLKEGTEAESSLSAWLFSGKPQEFQMAILRDRQMRRFSELLAGAMPTEADIKLGFAAANGQINTSHELYQPFQKGITETMGEVIKFAQLMDGTLQPTQADREAGYVSTNGEINQQHPYYLMLSRAQQT
ncbi:MAG: hypothetical protein WCW67_03985 [Candidatus Margulisiibacteriota bacterium]|jgi:hypothetical protein